MVAKVFGMLLCGVLGSLVFVTAASPALAAPPSPSSLPFEQRVLDVIRSHPEAILEALERYEQQKQQEQRDKQATLLRDLFPVPARIIGESPVRASNSASNSKTLLVEFSDFQCPYCAQAQRQLKALLDQQGKGFRMVYKHFPLSQIHPQALPAARAAWAAGRQGKFWEYHDALFSNQSKLSDAFYQEVAKDLGLNLDVFNRDRNGDASLQAIREDLALAERLNLQGTPTFLLERGGRLEVISLDELLASPSPQAKAP
jgi:protein-disulfide isomerase